LSRLHYITLHYISRDHHAINFSIHVNSPIVSYLNFIRMTNLCQYVHIHIYVNLLFKPVRCRRCWLMFVYIHQLKRATVQNSATGKLEYATYRVSKRYYYF